LGEQAEALGVDVFPGFAAKEILYDENGAVKGVATGDMGVGRDGQPTDAYQPGMELHARYTIFAEGSRGQLGRQLIERFKLDSGRDPQSYAIGIKEMWEVDPAQSKPGLVMHTAGWPLDSDSSEAHTSELQSRQNAVCRRLLQKTTCRSSLLSAALPRRRPPASALFPYTTLLGSSGGQLGRQLIERFKLDSGRDPQSYAIGIKEMWEVDPAQSKPGLVMHTAGWPLDSD